MSSGFAARPADHVPAPCLNRRGVRHNGAVCVEASAREHPPSILRTSHYRVAIRHRHVRTREHYCERGAGQSHRAGDGWESSSISRAPPPLLQNVARTSARSDGRTTTRPAAFARGAGEYGGSRGKNNRSSAGVNAIATVPIAAPPETHLAESVMNATPLAMNAIQSAMNAGSAKRNVDGEMRRRQRPGRRRRQ
jgi:hypothetical protein